MLSKKTSVPILFVLAMMAMMTMAGITSIYAQPSQTWVDDDYCNVCSNDGHTWAYDAFNKIQDGVDAVRCLASILQRSASGSLSTVNEVFCQYTFHHQRYLRESFQIENPKQDKKIENYWDCLDSLLLYTFIGWYLRNVAL